MTNGLSMGTGSDGREEPGRHQGWSRHLLAELRGRVGKDVGSTTLGNLVGALAAFAGGAVLARWLGPSGRGAFELGVFAANSALLVLGLGLNLPVSVFFSRAPAKGVWAYRFGLRWLLVSIAIGGGVVLAWHRILPRTNGPGGYQGLALGTLAVFAGLFLTQLVNGVAIGLGRIQRLNLGVVVRWGSYFAGIAAFSIAIAPDAQTALAWYAAAALLSTLVVWWGVRDVDRSAALAREARGSRLEALWYGVRGQLSNVFQFASYRLDVLLVGLWIGTAGLGVYAVGTLFAEALWLLPNAVGTVLLSHTSRSSVSESDRRIAIVFPATMAVVLLGAVVVSVAAPASVAFYFGPAYAKVTWVTWLLLPGTVALSGSKVLANELTARGFPGVNTIVAVFGASTTVVGDLMLIPRYGIEGASVASSIGYSVSFLLTMVAFRRKTGARLLLRRGAPVKVAL